MGLVPDVVSKIFRLPNPSGCTIALVLTHPLTKMSIRDLSWGVRAVGTYG